MELPIEEHDLDDETKKRGAAGNSFSDSERIRFPSGFRGERTTER